MKVCTVCHAEKPLSSFSAQAKGRFGVTSQCKSCASARGIAWHGANRERSLASKLAYSASNKEARKVYSEQWRLDNAERSKAVAAAWTARNLDRKRASTAKRRAARLQAIPPWATASGIKRFYRLANDLTKTTGIKAQVDHVVPLQHPLVCGLHCEANLSVTTEVLNKRKGNLWWPDMPDPPPITSDWLACHAARGAVHEIHMIHEADPA